MYGSAPREYYADHLPSTQLFLTVQDLSSIAAEPSTESCHLFFPLNRTLKSVRLVYVYVRHLNNI